MKPMEIPPILPRDRHPPGLKRYSAELDRERLGVTSLRAFSAAAAERAGHGRDHLVRLVEFRATATRASETEAAQEVTLGFFFGRAY